MFAKIQSLATSQTGKDTIIVFWGTVANVILGGLFFIIAPRLLGPENYGLFATIYLTSALVVRLTSLGIDVGILRFTNKVSKEANDFLVIALKWYLFLGFASAVIGYFLSPKLAIFLGQPSLVALLRIAFAATVLFHLTNLLTSALQAKREFKKAVLLLIANNLLRLLLVFLVIYFLFVNLISITLIFFFSTIAAVAIGGFLLPIEIKKIKREQEKKFFNFNFWIWISLTLSVIPYDNYLLLKITGPIQAGVYAAPFRLLNYAYQLGGNFTSVLASRLSTFQYDSEAKVFSKKASVFPIIFSLVFVFFIIFSKFITKILFGNQFKNASQVLSILSVGSIFFFLATIPSSIILYYFGKSQISFIITLLKYLLFVVLLLSLIPTYGAQGAALAFSLSEGFGLLAMSAYVLFKFQKNNAN